MSAKQSQYDIGLDQTPANYVPLTPLSFLARTAAIYPDHISAVYEERVFTWSETHARCRRFASYLAGRNIGRGDTIAAMLPNIPAMNELHFAVPMAGAVLNALNIRLDAPSIAFQLDHGAAKIVLVDPEFAGVISEALRLMSGPKPLVIDVDDAAFGDGKRIGELEYEEAVAQGHPGFEMRPPGDEWDAIALSYTSGTTGNPKGVVTHHRGAYLNAISNILAGNNGQHPDNLSTLPLFHGNGWGFPVERTGRWQAPNVPAQVGCPRIFDSMAAARRHPHLLCADVSNTMFNAPGAPEGKPDRPGLGGSSAGLRLSPCSRRRAHLHQLTHVYGLSENYGPVSVCAVHRVGTSEPADMPAHFKRRQAMSYALPAPITVIDPETMREMPHDGEPIGEIMFRGNVVMDGYLRNEKPPEKLRRRLVPYRRPRRDRRARLCHDQGPFQGHHYFGRREHLLGRNRRRPLQAPGSVVRGRRGQSPIPSGAKCPAHSLN